MSVWINLPSALEARLRHEAFDLDQSAKEAHLVGLYSRSTILDAIIRSLIVAAKSLRQRRVHE